MIRALYGDLLLNGMLSLMLVIAEPNHTIQYVLCMVHDLQRAGSELCSDCYSHIYTASIGTLLVMYTVWMRWRWLDTNSQYLIGICHVGKQQYTYTWKGTNHGNTGWISVDRRTKPTLNTYNTRMLLSRLQMIYHYQLLYLQSVN